MSWNLKCSEPGLSLTCNYTRPKHCFGHGIAWAKGLINKISLVSKNELWVIIFFLVRSKKIVPVRH